MSRSDAGADDPSARGSGAQAGVRVTPEIAAEAAVWVASLHGPDRDRAMEDEFRAWQQRSPAHREAFEKTTDVWQDIPRIKLADAYAAVDAQRLARNAAHKRSVAWRWATASGAAVLLAGAAVFFQQWQQQNTYATAIGEQRQVLLDDGTRMLLNTDTRLSVDYGAKRRTIEVKGGEALFEVAKDASRPFVVRVAGSEVVAVGTAFAVRFHDGPRTADALTVTLIEGQVNVRPTSGGGGGLAPKHAVALKPGDRLTLDHAARADQAAVEQKIDRPDIERAMAWKRNEAVFQDTPLAGAVDEINRYSRTQVTLSNDVQQANLNVSGVFRTGDSAAFASAVAVLHGLKVREAEGRLQLETVR